MEWFVAYALLALIIGAIASAWNRHGFGWFLLTLALTPLLSMLLLVLVGKRPTVAEQFADDQLPTPRTHVRCPDCRELVRKDARKCRHCGITLIPQ